MQKNLGMFFWVPRLGVGVVLLALFAFTSASRAGVIVDNITGNTFVNGTTAKNYKSQGFDATQSGPISSVSLELSFSVGTSGSMSVYLVTANSSGQPTEAYTAGINLGTIYTSEGVDGTPSTYAVENLASSVELTAGDYYAIVIYGKDPSLSGGNPSWMFLPPARDDANFLGAYSSGDGISFSIFNSAEERGLEINEVPEVPMTGMMMGIGALCLAAGHTLRRKLCAAKSA